MAHSFDFPVFPREADLDAMDKEQLRESLEAIQAQICQLDEAEPEDMESEAYEDWGDRHEELEDLLDLSLIHILPSTQYISISGCSRRTVSQTWPTGISSASCSAAIF